MTDDELLRMERRLLKRIVVDPKVMAGKPVIRGTRIPVDTTIYRIARLHGGILAFAEKEKRIPSHGPQGFRRTDLQAQQTRIRGVILLRTSSTDTQKRFESVVRTIASVHVEGNFTMVTEGRVKTWSPP